MENAMVMMDVGGNTHVQDLPNTTMLVARRVDERVCSSSSKGPLRQEFWQATMSRFASFGGGQMQSEADEVTFEGNHIMADEQEYYHGTAK